MRSTTSPPLEALARVTDLLAGATAEGGPVDGESLAALRRCIDRLEAVFVASLCRFEDAGDTAPKTRRVPPRGANRRVRVRSLPG